MREILKLVKSCCELADHKWLRSKVEEVLNSLNCCSQPECKSLSIRIRLEKADLPQLGFGILLAICYCCVWAGRNGSLGWYGVLYTLLYFYITFTLVHYTSTYTGKLAAVAILFPIRVSASWSDLYLICLLYLIFCLLSISYWSAEGTFLRKRHWPSDVFSKNVV